MESEQVQAKETDYKAIITEIRNIYKQDLLQNQTVLVTGGSRGIGKAIAIALGALGAKVAVNYAGNEAAALETAQIITDSGSTAKIYRFNVSLFSETQEAIKNIEKDFGSIDILVNNAGISKDSLIARFREEDWDSVIDTNLKGVFNCCRAVVMGMMKKRCGKIINVSSVIGLTGNAGQIAYAASKSGIFGLSMSLAKELASRNIQVNTIAPGYIHTDMTASHGEKLVTDVLGKIPLGRLGDPIDIAKLAVFLAAPTSDYITGQTLAVDGGMTMH